ncbi:hypothetical protein JCM19300_2813 [Algibacter lectus]|uniref:Uncharacterized protein n=1 Tax=Algibacter lectus TaxID=221126 RepID=A0A090X219_9FLAO|nr:hypothetical protein JCM19300_2813 [Algibacter lectus]GAL82229.1 hypothetical protein JCM19274_4417 [Algibacter lectus]
MAKIKHNNFLDTVNNVFTDAIDEAYFIYMPKEKVLTEEL